MSFDLGLSLTLMTEKGEWLELETVTEQAKLLGAN